MSRNPISAGSGLQAQAQSTQNASQQSAASCIDAIFARGVKLHEERTAGTRSVPPPSSEAKAVADSILAATPATSITGVASSQKGDEENQKGGQADSRQVFPGGLDWLEISVEGSWSDAPHACVARSALVYAAEDAARDWQPVTVEIAGQVWKISPGKAPYGNGQAVILAQCDGITYHFSKQTSSAPGRPLIWLRATSEALMLAGDWWTLWQQAVATLAAIGVTITDTTVSRFDACVDLVGVPMKEFARRYANDAYISRATHDTWYREHKQVTGLRFGKGLICRVYDKLLEVILQETKAEVILKTRWGDKHPDHALRVEFQVRREAMREKFSIKTVEELREKLPGVCHELTHDWLRFTEETVDRENKHQDRAKTWEVWQRVQASFAATFGPGQRLARPTLKPPAGDALKRSALGSLLTAWATQHAIRQVNSDARPLPVVAGPDLLHEFAGMLASVLPPDFLVRMQQRVDTIRQRFPTLDSSPPPSLSSS